MIETCTWLSVLVDGRMVILAEAPSVPLVAQSRNQLAPNQIIKLAIMKYS